MIVLSWKDTRGYTLVELIISMAMLAIVSGTIMFLMQSGTKSYSNTKAELDLQMESQTLMAQLNTMVLEANCVNYDDVNKVLALYQIETEKVALPVPSDAASSLPKYEVHKTVKDLKMIKFHGSNKQLYLEEHDTDVLLPASGGALTFYEEELLGDYVSSFDVDVEGSNVTINIEMEKQKKKYVLTETTKMRSGLVTYP